MPYGGELGLPCSPDTSPLNSRDVSLRVMPAPADSADSDMLSLVCFFECRLPTIVFRISRSSSTDPCFPDATLEAAYSRFAFDDPVRWFPCQRGSEERRSRVTFPAL